MDKITDKIPYKWKPKVDSVETFIYKNTQLLSEERECVFFYFHAFCFNIHISTVK